MNLQVVLPAALAAALSASALAQATFTGIGDLAGGTFSSAALGLSPDGTRAVGYATSAAGTRAVVFAAGTLTPLADPNGTYTLLDADAISNAGVITGTASGPSGFEAFKYNLAGPNRFRPLGGAGLSGSSGRAVSSAGSTVAGRRENPDGSLEAVRWDGPSPTGLGFLDPEFPSSYALGMSADTAVIAGGSATADGVRAFIFTNDLMSQLDAPGAAQSEALAVSADGSTIVGTAAVNGSINHAARWAHTAFADLGDLPGGPDNSGALAVSADGSTIGGYAFSASGQEAVIWRGGQTLRVRDLLLAAGLSTLSNWSLTSVTGISADGLTLCGTGTGPSGPEGWVAHLPPPTPPCPADFNGDGFLDFFDYDDYVNCFETGVCPPGRTADFNGDNFADFFDYDDFVAAFEAGC